MVELEQELLAFPKARHDDLIDALCMQIKFWYGITESYNNNEKEKDEGYDMTGDSVIKELQDRVKNIQSYPYDVGSFGDFAKSKQNREYVYN